MTHKIQIDDLVRDATSQEIEEIMAREAEAAAKLETQATKAEAKAAILERLGITADEAALLLS